MDKKKNRKDKPVEEETSQQLGMFQTDLLDSVLGNVLSTDDEEEEKHEEVGEEN